MLQFEYLLLAVDEPGEPRVAVVSVFMRGRAGAVEQGEGRRGCAQEMAGADYLTVAALTPLPRETQPPDLAEVGRETRGWCHSRKGKEVCQCMKLYSITKPRCNFTATSGGFASNHLFILSKPICRGVNGGREGGREGERRFPASICGQRVMESGAFCYTPQSEPTHIGRDSEREQHMAQFYPTSPPLPPSRDVITLARSHFGFRS